MKGGWYLTHPTLIYWQVANMHMMLQAVRALVSPSISQKERSVCQRRMNQSGLLQQLCTILMATGIPADVLTECINTVAEVIRGHPDNQVGICSMIALKLEANWRRSYCPSFILS